MILERTTVLIDKDKKARLKVLAKVNLEAPNNNLSDLVRQLIDKYLDENLEKEN